MNQSEGGASQSSTQPEQIVLEQAIGNLSGMPWGKKLGIRGGRMHFREKEAILTHQGYVPRKHEEGRHPQEKICPLRCRLVRTHDRSSICVRSCLHDFHHIFPIALP